MFKLINESKTQNNPDDYITFEMKSPLYFANSFRRALTYYPLLYAYGNFQVTKNTTNIEDPDIIQRIQMLPVIQSKVKTGNEKFKISFKNDTTDKYIQLLSDDIKPNFSHTNHLLGMIKIDQELKLDFELIKGSGTSMFHASSVPKMKYSGDLTTIDTGTFTFEITSVGAVEPRQQCIMTFETMIDELDKLDKGDTITYESQTNILHFIVTDISDIILQLVRCKIIELYPNIGNVGYTIIHLLKGEKYKFNICDKSKNPMDIFKESIKEVKMMIKKYIEMFKKI